MSLIATNQSVVYGVAGVNVIQPILIGFFDAIEQLVGTDTSSTAEFKSDQIIGTTSLVAKGGVANFSSIILQAIPGRTVPIQVQSKSINQTFPKSPEALYSFKYVTRLCVPGEVTTAVGCYLCPKNTFSVDPNDTECKECPGYASCPGGMALVLDPGYWRESDLSSEVFECPIVKACEGETMPPVQLGMKTYFVPAVVRITTLQGCTIASTVKCFLFVFSVRFLFALLQQDCI
jgi:hypothetical protein